MGRSSLGEVEKSEGQGLVAGGGWVVREKETRKKENKGKEGQQKREEKKKDREEISFS